MKIAIFSDNFYPELGGIQDSLASLGLELSKRGHQINFYAPKYSAKDFSVAKIPNKEINLGKNVKIIRFFSLPVPSPTKQSRLVVPLGLRWRQTAEFKPDIIHSHTFFGLGIEAIVAARRLKLPLVGTNHWSITEFGCYYPKFCEEWFKRISLKYVIWFYNQCDYVTAPARFLLEEMSKSGLRKPNQIVSNQINTAVFNKKYDREKARKRFKLSAATIMFAGRLGREKNIEVIIRAVELVKKEIKNINFAIAGHGSDEVRLKKLTKDLYLKKEVKFMGTFDHENLAKLYQASDIFVIASTTEVQSMVTMQAMACGLPAIGVNWRTMPELINDRNGFLVESGNHKQLAKKIIFLLKNKGQRIKLGQGAYEFVQQFSAANIAKKWEELYKKTVEDYKART